MKKKIALLLAAVMVVAMVPVSAFATSKNAMTKTVVVKEDTILTSAAETEPVLKVQLEDKMLAGESFELVLDGAEWKIWAYDLPGAHTVTTTQYTVDGIISYLNVGGQGTYKDSYAVTLLDAQTLSVRATADVATGTVFTFPMEAKVTGETATVTVVPNNTVVTAGTYTFATTTAANATAKTNGTIELEVEGGAKELKSIVIAETVKDALDDAKDIKVKLYGNFKFTAAGQVVSTDANLSATVTKVADDELKIDLTGSSTDAAKLSLVGVMVQADGASAGDVAEIVMSGAGLGKTTLEVAKAVTYGVSFTVEDKKLPVFYAGRKYASDDTLKVTFKELAEDSWWAARKTTLTFPEGVKVIGVEFTGDVTTGQVTWKNNVVTIPAGTYTNTAKKAEWKADFNLSISPDFVGEITCTVGGPAVAEDITVVVAEADYAVTFEVEVSDVSIDYRNVAVGDITITEAFAGALAKDTELYFYLDEIAFESGSKIEIVEGDIKLYDLNETDADAGDLGFKVKSPSYKTPAVIKITNNEAYLHRALPAGSYALKVGGVVNNVALSDAIFQNYGTKTQVKENTTSGLFNVANYTLADAYIEVVTAGRDQDDATFTTQVAVTIGANTMVVGQGVVALDVPAYIANGYTMLPVRAVADALSGDAATVLWDGATQTVTIAFGARIIGMTIGSKVMNINGVAVAMSAAPEITNGRTFLPVRDLGYALGLTDADINWDDATKTATLN